MMRAARALFAIYALGTTIYALLAYDPFTYTQVIRFELLAGLSAFARWHSWLSIPAFACAIGSIRPAFAHRRARIAAWGFSALALVAVASLLLHPLLPRLESNGRSLLVAMLALVPLLWLSLVDLLLSIRAAPREGDPARSLASASALTGLSVFAAFAVVALLRGEKPSAVLAYVLLLHALLASLIAGVLLFVTSFRSTLIQLGLGTLALAACFGFASSRALAAIAFPPAMAPLIAAAFAIVLSLSLLGLGLRRAQAISIELLFNPLSLPRFIPRPLRIGAPLIACAALSWAAASYDWNFLLQSTCVFAAWLLTLAAWIARDEDERAPTPGFLAAASAIALICALATRAVAGGQAVSASMADALAHDASLRVLAPSLRAGQGAGVEFFETLARHTNLPASQRIDPLDVQLSNQPLARTPARKPDIYLIVIDSLRRDYVAPYNRAAESFTPQVAAFARDAVVFENAFTRYGATGLSEPSIWVGGMMPHKQYITPFAPLNALVKLLSAEGYVELVSVDTILEIVLPASPKLIKLDAGVANKDYSLCRSLAELRQKAAAIDRTQSVFAYTQPQDIHVSRIAREGARIPPGVNYPEGIHPPVAARLQAMDACFGDFVHWLDGSGRGDDAIVILTSDHGDSLGEEGRWGHAYTIYPEVIRIPLLMRLPKAWRSRARCRRNELAFSADVTPTLYQLLGHPVAERPPFGAPLCALDGEPAPRHQGPQLVASSYGPVYGLVEDGGARLYIADAVNYAEDAYSIGEGAARRIAEGEAERADARRLLLDKLGQLESTYGLRLK